MKRLHRPIAAAVLFALAIGCSKDEPTKSPPSRKIVYKVNPDTDFKDDAAANRQVPPADMSLTFETSAGKKVALTDYRDKSPVVLVVLRGIPVNQVGIFCPGCLAQTGSLSANKDAFKTRGAEVLLVFPGPTERLNAFIEQAKTDARLGPPEGLPFPVLLDKDLAVCKKLGIQGDLAKPSTYVLDRQGNVVYAYVGETYIDRPSLKAILAQLDKLPKPGE